MPHMNSGKKTEFMEKIFFFENFVITVISFGKMAENFFRRKNIFQVIDSISYWSHSRTQAMYLNVGPMTE